MDIKFELGHKICNNRYTIVNLLESGTFGDVYTVQDENWQYYVAKLEKQQPAKPCYVKKEYNWYRMIDNQVPKMKEFYNNHKEIKALIMEKLGPSL